MDECGIIKRKIRGIPAGIKYEPSSHGHLVHVEVYCSKDEETYLNAILDGLEG